MSAESTRATVDRSNAIFNDHDADVLAEVLTDLWTYRKLRNGQSWHLRGVDIFTVRDGKVAAKLAYVKG